MWVVGTVRVSHCDHNSFSGTAENMGVIHTKSSKACCSFFSLSLFSPHCDLVWPLRDILSFAIQTGDFMVLFLALLYSNKSDLSDKKNGLEERLFTAGSDSDAEYEFFCSVPPRFNGHLKAETIQNKIQQRCGRFEPDRYLVCCTTNEVIVSNSEVFRRPLCTYCICKDLLIKKIISYLFRPFFYICLLSPLSSCTLGVSPVHKKQILMHFNLGYMTN